MWLSSEKGRGMGPWLRGCDDGEEEAEEGENEFRMVVGKQIYRDSING